MIFVGDGELMVVNVDVPVLVVLVGFTVPVLIGIPGPGFGILITGIVDEVLVEVAVEGKAG